MVNERAFRGALQPNDQLMQEIENAKFNKAELKKVFALIAIDEARTRQVG